MNITLPLVFIVLANPSPPSPLQLRTAVEKALPLLRQAAETHAEKKTCFACHNQTYPLQAFASAQRLGFPFSEEFRAAQVEHIRNFVRQNRKEFESGRGTGGQIDTAGWLLSALTAAGEKPDADTDAILGYILQRHADRSHWGNSSNRPPSQISPFTTSFLAVQALKTWGRPKQQDAITKRLNTVRDWAVKARARDTEDHVYRLRLLHETGADPQEIQKAKRQLIDLQHLDGGWSQDANRASDAYATATALVALNAVNTPAREAAINRGANYLLRTQRPDGSWHVKTHSPPIQRYYEAGFPYEKDQFISVTATSWAIVALARISDR